MLSLPTFDALARFMGNPHIVLATKKDYGVPVPLIRTTFPEPLPPYLPRNIKLPSIVPPTRNPNSANAGRFSLSLKGMRRELRKSGVRAQVLVLDIEAEMVTWLRDGGTVLAPDAVGDISLNLPGAPLRTTESIRQVSRTPLQLVWSISDDPFARYVVHCCARYHEVVSFSECPPPHSRARSRSLTSFTDRQRNIRHATHVSSPPERHPARFPRNRYAGFSPRDRRGLHLSCRQQ